jgi:hypothetical protein
MERRWRVGTFAAVVVAVDWRRAARELIDDWSAMEAPERRASLVEVPVISGDVRDVYVAALAEHLTAAQGWAAPEWSRTSERFSDTFWFASDAVGLIPTQLRESPPAFRRRSLFIGRSTLSRA